MFLWERDRKTSLGTGLAPRSGGVGWRLWKWTARVGKQVGKVQVSRRHVAKLNTPRAQILIETGSSRKPVPESEKTNIKRTLNVLTLYANAATQFGINQHLHIAEHGHLRYIERDHTGTIELNGTAEHAFHLACSIGLPAR